MRKRRFLDDKEDNMSKDLFTIEGWSSYHVGTRTIMAVQVLSTHSKGNSYQSSESASSGLSRKGFTKLRTYASNPIKSLASAFSPTFSIQSIGDIIRENKYKKFRQWVYYNRDWAVDVYMNDDNTKQESPSKTKKLWASL
ncbi:hypothetical protein M9H77_35891 [Catharanthus roseus]|uniref:Uncharacterized protein n=1 Tax=Catharanthus roseus TaxID=4058 RepID=A0ACB9ZSV3_CATRO|nr:hypothetical protein M9H77_35891 [Catharanthus roseus]